VSIRTRIINKLVALQMSGWSKGSIKAQRTRQARALRYVRLPADIHYRPANAEGVPAAWIEAPGADFGVLLYLHGGAFCLGSIDSSREWVARLARATNMRALAIDYRLAPEHPYPAALDDAVRCAGKAREVGVDVTLETWDGMFHVFQMFPFLPETKRAVESIATFVAQRLAQ
jgi:acetyl esterase/lipase